MKLTQTTRIIPIFMIFSLALTTIVCAVEIPAEPTGIYISTDKPNAIYRKGENITFAISLRNKNSERIKFFEITHYVNGKIKDMKILAAEPAAKYQTSLDTPGWVAISVKALNAKKNPLSQPEDTCAQSGVIIAPKELLPAVPPPPDFEAFWEKQRDELNRVAIHATRNPVPVNQTLKGKVVCYDVKVPCCGNNPVSGYLALPEKAAPKSLPAFVSFHGAGVRSADKPFRYADKAICFDVNAHGIDNGREPDYYASLNRGALKDYPIKGSDSQKVCYFNGVFLRVMRALDYVKRLPEWDGKTLIVFGGSQGGAQALVAAALDSQVTLCIAEVPALGDLAGGFAGRCPGWPRFYQVKDGRAENDAVKNAVAYFDTCNFARRIKCETYLSTGFIDFICAPTSVYAIYNSLPPNTRKDIYTKPYGTHSDGNNPVAVKRISEIINKVK